MLMSVASLCSHPCLTRCTSLSLAGPELRLRLDSTRSNPILLTNASERASACLRTTHTQIYIYIYIYIHTHIHREPHGALFVQTINDVAQGHPAHFGRISIVVVVVIIIIIERLLRERERGRKEDVHHAYVRVTSLHCKEGRGSVRAHSFAYG